MRPIPSRLRNLLDSMPRMRTCEIGAWHPEFGACDIGIEWHHVWIYAGTQVNEVWAILAACRRHHDAVKTDRAVKEAFERRSLEIATDAELARYNKVNWKQLKKYLFKNEKNTNIEG